jgi:hypothetical protein
MDTEHPPEHEDSLWMLTAAPVIWAAHFLLSYLTAALWCGMVVGRGGSLATARIAIAAYTALALTGIAVVGWVGYRRHSYGAAPLPHDLDTPEDRHRFLGFATLLLSGVSAIATIYVALAAVFIGSCN